MQKRKETHKNPQHQMRRKKEREMFFIWWKSEGWSKPSVGILKFKHYFFFLIDFFASPLEVYLSEYSKSDDAWVDWSACTFLPPTPPRDIAVLFFCFFFCVNLGIFWHLPSSFCFWPNWKRKDRNKCVCTWTCKCIYSFICLFWDSVSDLLRTILNE